MVLMPARGLHTLIVQAMASQSSLSTASHTQSAATKENKMKSQTGMITKSLKGMAYDRKTSDSLFHTASSANISIVWHLYEYEKVI